MEPGEETSGRSAAQRRAESRRRRLLQNSEQRMNRIVGFNKSDSDSSGQHTHTHIPAPFALIWAPNTSRKCPDSSSPASCCNVPFHLKWRRQNVTAALFKVERIISTRSKLQPLFFTHSKEKLRQGFLQSSVLEAG